MTQRKRNPTAARRVRTWARRTIGASNIASGAVAHFSLQSVLENDLGRTLGEYTVARLIGDFYLAAASVTTTPDIFGMGVVIVGRDAAAAGTTSLPTPLSNFHADWMWWWAGTPPGTAVESGTGLFHDIPRFVAFDVRSMRKVQERDEIPVLVVENSVGQAMTFAGGISALLLRS